MHEMAAHFLGSQYLAIDMSEAQKLDTAISRVAEFYDVPEVNPLVASWVMLAQTLGMVYGTRYMAWRTDQRANAARPVAPVRGDPASQPRTEPQPPVDIPMPTNTRRVMVDGVGMVDEVLPEGVRPPRPGEKAGHH